MAEPGSGPRVTLLTRAGCHLCEAAREVVRAVVGPDFAEVDIAGSADLTARYTEEIPVVLVDGRQISYWRIEESRLRAALADPPPGAPLIL